MRSLAVIALATAACTQHCKPARDAGLAGATVSDGTAIVSFGGFSWSKNNDCGLSSITVDGTQTSPATTTPFHLSFCLPSPSELDGDTVAIDDTHVVDFGASGDDGAATFTTSTSTSTTAKIDFEGVCPDMEGSPFTFAMSGTIAGTLTPGGPVTLTLGGTVTAWGAK